jgi:prepilin-type processing-associated H-X9-DG protein
MAREAARRSQCRNSLHQWALALDNYESTYRMYPAAGEFCHNGLVGVDPWGCSTTDVVKLFSAHSRILPFIEHNAVYNAINFQRDSHGLENRTAASINLDVFYCASDPQAMQGSVHNSGTPGFPAARWASTNYRVNVGNMPSAIGSWHRMHAGGGPYHGGMFEYVSFGWPGNKFLEKRDVTDGLSHTATVSESIRGKDGQGTLGNGLVDRSTVYYAPSPGWWDSKNGLRLCKTQGTVATFGHNNHSGLFWIRAEALYTMYNHGLTPNQRNCSTLSSDAGDGSWPIGMNINAMSYHPGGVNMAFADGSVRFVGDNVDEVIYYNIGHRDEGKSHEGF